MPNCFDDAIDGFEQHLPGGGIVHVLSAGSGPLSQGKLTALIQAFEAIPPQQPVLLQSDSLTLPEAPESEHLLWLECAGRYRRLQESFKHRGGRLFSLVTETLYGGTYLLHGMAAPWRMVYPETRIYPALPPEIYQKLTRSVYPHSTDPQTALKQSMITHRVQPSDLWDTMATWIASA